MPSRHYRAPAVAAALLLAAALVLLTSGCGKKDAAGTGAAGTASAVDAGKAVFAANGCAGCHGTPGQAPGRAPDLSHEGARHDQQWIAAQVENPRSHNPDSRMPAFAGRIADPDLQNLGAYLASLK